MSPISTSLRAPHAKKRVTHVGEREREHLAPSRPGLEMSPSARHRSLRGAVVGHGTVRTSPPICEATSSHRARRTCFQTRRGCHGAPVPAGRTGPARGISSSRAAHRPGRRAAAGCLGSWRSGWPLAAEAARWPPAPVPAPIVSTKRAVRLIRTLRCVTASRLEIGQSGEVCMYTRSRKVERGAMLRGNWAALHRRGRALPMRQGA